MRTRKKTKPLRGKRKLFKRANPSRAHAVLVRNAKLDTLGAVAAVFAHESRNLLGALGTCVQVLRRNPNLTSDDAELLDIIQSGANRLNEIVGQFSVFRSGKALRINEVKLHEIIDATLAALQRDERYSSSIVVRRRFDASPISIKADGERLGQALWHLLLNAAQAMRDRGQLDVQTRQIGRKVEISVHDSGPGIPANVMPRIFEPLFSTKTRGAGLGLAIARRIVEEHGGTITAQSEAGKGARFIVRLPVGSK